MNTNLDRFLNSSFNIEGPNIVDHILEFPRLDVLIINCLAWNTRKTCSRNNTTRYIDDKEVVI